MEKNCLQKKEAETKHATKANQVAARDGHTVAPPQSGLSPNVPLAHAPDQSPEHRLRVAAAAAATAFAAANCVGRYSTSGRKRQMVASGRRPESAGRHRWRPLLSNGKHGAVAGGGGGGAAFFALPLKELRRRVRVARTTRANCLSSLCRTHEAHSTLYARSSLVLSPQIRCGAPDGAHALAPRAEGEPEKSKLFAATIVFELKCD